MLLVVPPAVGGETPVERSVTPGSVRVSLLAHAAASSTTAIERIAFFMGDLLVARESIGRHRSPGWILHVTGCRAEPLAHAPVAGNRRELPASRDLRFVKDHLTVGGEAGGIVERGVGARLHLPGGKLHHRDAVATAV